MSWNARLTAMDVEEPDSRDDADDLYALDSWNYTHNCNKMIESAMKAVGEDEELDDQDEVWWSEISEDDNRECMGQKSWWKILDGMNGQQSKSFFRKIIRELGRRPEKYKKLNPPNGWGDYETLLEVLKSMEAEVRRAESITEGMIWSTSG